MLPPQSMSWEFERMTKRDVAVVTGAAQGVGYGIAAAFVDAGYNVVLMDLNQEAVEAAAASLTCVEGQVVLAAHADVTDAGQIASATAWITGQLGSVDILVNNAGIVRDRRFVKMEEEDWDAVVATNLKSQFLTCKAMVPPMIERGYGRIVNISSRAWLGGFGQANYSAAKGGVVSFTRSLAIELARDGITVNAIAPGIIDTPMFAGFKDRVQENLRKSVPSQRIGTPEDVAQAALFFASRASSYITGQLIYVCGGRSLSSPSL